MSRSRERRPWSDEEVAGFYEGLVRHHKNFPGIAADVGTRTAAECVEYYYLWKNLCREESRSFKAVFAASAAATAAAEEEDEGEQQQQQQQQQQQLNGDSGESSEPSMPPKEEGEDAPTANAQKGEGEVEDEESP